MNPSTAFAAVFAEEFARCGLREAVVAPGSRSAPLALAFWELSQPAAARQDTGHRDAGQRGGGKPVRLHVRIDERSAGFLALGLAKAGGAPAVVLCTSGTAAAHLHAAVIEADEARVPLIVVTADRPPELRGTGANQAIDQLKLYGGAVRWFCDTGVPEPGAEMNAYWRSLACRAWAAASGAAGGLPGPVHVNVPLREPLIPDEKHWPDPAAQEGGWPEGLSGRADGRPWTAFGHCGRDIHAYDGGVVELPWAERGVIVCGDGGYAPEPLLELADAAGWPVLAEPSSGVRVSGTGFGARALSAYPYLLASPEFMASHTPDVIVSAGRPGLSRQQLALLRTASARHVVIADGAGRWSDPARFASDVASAVRLVGGPGGGGSGGGGAGRGGGSGGRGGGWLASWQQADMRAREAADAILDAGPGLSEPRLARDVAAALPNGSLLWVASSLPVRDLDHHMAPRPGLRVLANRGASGIDGLSSSAMGAALAHQAAGGGPAVALLGDLAFLHDLPGLVLGPEEPRPDLALVVVNNNGGGIFSLLEQAELPGPFERLFGTPHGAAAGWLAALDGLSYQRLERPADLPHRLEGKGLRIVEVMTDRAAGAALRGRLAEACIAAATGQ